MTLQLTGRCIKKKRTRIHEFMESNCSRMCCNITCENFPEKIQDNSRKMFDNSRNNHVILGRIHSFMKCIVEKHPLKKNIENSFMTLKVIKIGI